jgi:TP901 family phage tail tape measure protein
MDAKEFAASTAYKAKYDAVYQLGRAQRGIDTFKKDSAAAWANAKEFAASTAYKAKYEAVYQVGKLRQNATANKAASAENSKRQIAGFNSTEFEKSMASTRYALYDVGQRFIGFGTAIAASLGQAVMASAKFESAFTSVERTSGVTGSAVGELRKQLIDLSTTIPVSFEQISQIATLGAQMGIAADSLDSFSSTVAKFAAVTGISVDEVAQSFGRLGQLMGVPASKFENLSSAISYAGSNAVATDREVLAMSESIAAASTQAGYSADQVIGLSTALASLKIRPEEARGVIVRLFREIDMQVTTGGKKLQDFSKVMKMSAEDTKSLWKSDPSAFFNSFISGAKSAGNLNEIITSLGITNSRELNVIQRLAGSTDMLARSMADAREQYLLGTYAQESYNKVADDLASKVKVLQNSFEAFQASIGDTMSEAIGFIVDKLKVFIDFLAGLPSPIKFAGAAIAVAAAIFATLFGGLAMGIAGLLAMKLAFNNLGKAGLDASISIGTFRALLKSMTVESGLAGGALGLLGVKAQTASTSVKILGMSTKTLMASLGIIGAVILVATTAMEIFGNMSKDSSTELDRLGKATLDANGGLSEFLSAVNKDSEAAANGAQSIGKLTFKMSDAAKAAAALKTKNLATAESVDALVSGVADGSAAIGNLAGATDTNTTAQDANNASVQESIDLQKEQTKELGRATAAFLIQAAAKYSGNDGEIKNFFIQQVEDPTVTKAAEALGFNIADAVANGLKKPGSGTTEYVDSIASKLAELEQMVQASVNTSTGSTAQNAANAVDLFAKRYNLSSEAVASLNAYLKENNYITAGIPAYYQEWAKASDGTVVSAQNQVAAAENLGNALNSVGAAAGDTGEGMASLDTQLQTYIDTLTAAATANGSTVDSFEGLSKSAKESDGSIKGLSKNSRKNMSDWKSFMDSALKAGIAEGDAFNGSIARMAAALIVLKGAGKDVSGQFNMMKSIVLTNLGQLGKEYDTLAIALSNSTDLDAALKAVDTWLANNKGAVQGVLDVVTNLRNALAGGTYVADFSAAFKAAEVSAGKAKTAIEKMSEALDKLFEKFNRKMNLESALDSLGASLAKNKKNFSVFTDDGRANITALQEVISQLAISADGDKQKMANSLQSLKTAFMQMGIVGGTAVNLLNTALKSTGKTGKNVSSQIKNAVNSITGAFTEALTSDTKDSVRLIGDYVSDLQSILSDAFDNRYGKQTGLDDIASAWEGIRDSAKSAREAIEDANKTIAGLNVDRNLLDYQLKVAIKYKDTKRETAIKNKIAEVDAKLREESAKISENFATLNKSLNPKDTSKAAIENRNQVRGMVKTYTDYLATLAKTGMSSDDLKTEAKKLAGEFLTQGQNLGFAKDELSAYTSAFEGDFTKTIDGLPRDFTLTVNTDPALRAIETFVQKANNELNKIVIPGSDKVAATPKPTAEEIAAYKKYKTVIADPKATYVSKIDARESMGFFESVFGSGYKRGGLIKGAGTGTSDSIPARLSNGEYVINANAVSRYGVDFMNSLNQMRASGPMPSSVGAGMGSGGSSMVYLSPEDRQLLRAAIDRPVALYTENTKIAASANAGNLLLAQRGSN